jgi:hypothetical protein
MGRFSAYNIIIWSFKILEKAENACKFILKDRRTTWRHCS